MLAHPRQPPHRQGHGQRGHHRLHSRPLPPLRQARGAEKRSLPVARRGHHRRGVEACRLSHGVLRQMAPRRGQGARARQVWLRRVRRRPQQGRQGRGRPHRPCRAVHPATQGQALLPLPLAPHRAHPAPGAPAPCAEVQGARCPIRKTAEPPHLRRHGRVHGLERGPHHGQARRTEARRPHAADLLLRQRRPAAALRRQGRGGDLQQAAPRREGQPL